MDEYKAARASGNPDWRKEYEDRVFARMVEKHPNCADHRMAVLCGHYTALLDYALICEEVKNA